MKEFAQGQTQSRYQRGPRLIKYVAATLKQSFHSWVVNLDLFIRWELPRCVGVCCVCVDQWLKPPTASLVWRVIPGSAGLESFP